MSCAPHPSAERHAAAQALCSSALHRMHTGQSDAGATVARALAIDPTCVRAQCLRAALLVVSGRHDGCNLLAQVLRDAAPQLLQALYAEEKAAAILGFVVRSSIAGTGRAVPLLRAFLRELQLFAVDLSVKLAGMPYSRRT